MEPVKIPKINLTKNKVINFTRFIEIIFVFLIYILSDYVKVGGTNEFRTDTAYWTNVIITFVLVVAMMLTVRALRKDNKIAKDIDIQHSMSQIQKGFKVITNTGFSAKLDDYIVKLNEDNKVDAFYRQTRTKLFNATKLETSFFGKFINKEKLKQTRKQLSDELMLPREEILKKNIKFKKITISKLFSAIDGKIINDNEFDLDTYETQDIAKMIGLKAVFVFLFCAFTGTIVVDLFNYGITAIYSTLLKIVSFIIAINSAMNVADDFVEHNLKTSIQRRLKHLAGFVNSTPELKELLENKKD